MTSVNQRDDVGLLLLERIIIFYKRKFFFFFGQRIRYKELGHAHTEDIFKSYHIQTNLHMN